MELTLQDIERQLNDGLNRTSEEREKCLKWLTEFYAANDMSLTELNELAV